MARKLAREGETRRPSETRNQHSSASERTLLGRRAYVKMGMTAAAATAGVVATAGNAAAATERQGIPFEQVLNAVDDLGMDPTGNRSVIDAIRRIPPNTLVQFPSGNYLIDERVDLPRLGNVGFEAIGDARIVGAAGFTETSWNVRDSNAVYYAGFTHDQTDGAVGHYWRVSDRIEMHDIDVVGRGGDWAVELSPHITEPDGLARIVNYTNKAGSGWANYAGSGGRIGCWLGEQHEGTIQFINCDFREYGNNALYTRAIPGNVQVIDSYFENNNVASVRIGGAGSFVENTTIVVDEARYTGPRENEDQSFFMRGVLIEDNHGSHEQTPAGAEIRNSEIIVENNPTAAPAVEVWANGRSLEITDTRIVYNNDGGTGVIRREDYRYKAGVHPPGEPPRWLRLRNCTISGTGDVPRVIDIEDGDGSIIENTQIAMWDNAADGVRITTSDDCLIEDSNIFVPGRATVFNDSTVETTRLTHEEPTDAELDESASDDSGSHGDDSEPDAPDDEDNPFTYDNAEGVHTDLPRELIIEHVEPGARVSYELEVDGELEAGEFDHPPKVDGSTATGGLGPERGLDNLYFDGEITRFEGANLAHVRMFLADAQERTLIREVDPATFPADNPFTYDAAVGVHTDLPKELVIEQVESGARVTYELEVDGELEAGEFDYPATVDGSSATGGMGPERGLDNLYFDGEVTRFEGDNLDHVRVFVADAQERTVLQEFDPHHFPADEQPPSTIHIQGAESGATYDLTVSGQLEDDPETTYDATHNISGWNAEGTVRAATHGYRFGGDVTDIRLSGSATVYLNGERMDVDDDEPLENELRIDGSMSDEVSTYHLTVTGRIEVSAAAEGGTLSIWDSLDSHVDGNTATGIVHTGIDAYRFSGDIASLELRGSAELSFDESTSTEG